MKDMVNNTLLSIVKKWLSELTLEMTQEMARDKVKKVEESLVKHLLAEGISISMINKITIL